MDMDGMQEEVEAQVLKGIVDFAVEEKGASQEQLASEEDVPRVEQEMDYAAVEAEAQVALEEVSVDAEMADAEAEDLADGKGVEDKETPKTMGLIVQQPWADVIVP